MVSLDIEEDVENNLPKMGTEEESRDTRNMSFKNVDAVSILEESLGMKYHYLSLFLDKAISLFPKSVELRLHNAYLQS